jgi:LytR cell envelope-related transcriptional attenuator
MRKSWPFALVVIVVGGLAGVAIAGRPEPGDPFVLDSSITVAGSAAEAATTTSVSESVPTTTITASTTVPPSTSVAPTTTATTAATTSTVSATTTTILGPLPRDQVRLVIANGDGRFRLASTTADRIRPLGYSMVLGDALQPVDATVIYYRPGFDDEAAYAADDIGVPEAIILPFPDNAPQPITDSDASGDVIVVLGPDAPR